jgi:flagellar hook-length control protein FliK
MDMTMPAGAAAPAVDQVLVPAGFARAAGRDMTIDPAPTGSGTDGETEPLGFEQLFADTRASLPAEPPSGAEEHADDRPVAETEPSVDAEQWLSNMLGQQAVSVQVHAGETREAQVQDPRLAGLRMPANPAPGMPSRAAEHGVEAMPEPVVALHKVTVSHELAASESGPSTLPLPAEAEASSSGMAERLPVTAAVASHASQPPNGVATSMVTQPPALERHLTLQAPEAKWGEQMLHALRDSIDLQLRHGSQQATIRLDPAELGSLEIQLSHEAGRLHVQINAGQADVARLLQQTSDRLRQELVGQNFMQVSVEVSSDGQPGRQQTRQNRAWGFEDEPVLASRAEEPRATGRAGKRADDVLVTV